MIALTLEQIGAWVQPLADVYSSSKAMSATTTAFHIGGLLGGGGLAIATDRAVLRVPKDDGAAQRSVLTDLSGTHTLVILALLAIVVSGLVFLAADIKTFAVSKVYWVKMALFAVLLLNGIRLSRIETRLKKAAAMAGDSAPLPAGDWSALRTSATTSLLFWFTIMVLGVVLANS